ncbi:hypothetical protein H7097_01885 [Aeromicrobium sp.]|nr:hypothetical protein [Candidatus Saccharibacteria bacterium]
MPDNVDDAQNSHQQPIGESDAKHEQSQEQSTDTQQHNDHDAAQGSEEEMPPVNLLEAIGIALFKNVDDSKINRPGKGELKRSLRLARLLIVMAVTVLSFIVVIALLANPLAGTLKLIGVLVFLAFTVRCIYVSVMLWKKLQ